VILSSYSLIVKQVKREAFQHKASPTKAANELGGNNLSGAGEKGWGKCWEGLGGYGSGFWGWVVAVATKSALKYTVLSYKTMDAFKYLLPGAAFICAGLLIPVNAETTYKVNCKADGDAIYINTTGEAILEQRLAKFTPLEAYGRNGQRGICVLKSDPPGFKWLRCGKNNGNYVIFTQFGGTTVVKPIKAIPNSVQYRGWSGACLVKL